MTVTRALLALAALAAALPTQAQVRPPLFGQIVDPHRFQAEQHRMEINALRARGDQRAAFADQLRLQGRLTRLELEAARQPALSPPPTYRILRSPGEERALREAATARRQSTVNAVTQIDAWLDRPAH